MFSYKTALLPKTDISYIYHFLEEKHFYKKNLVVKISLCEENVAGSFPNPNYKGAVVLISPDKVRSEII